MPSAPTSARIIREERRSAPSGSAGGGCTVLTGWRSSLGADPVPSRASLTRVAPASQPARRADDPPRRDD